MKKTLIPTALAFVLVVVGTLSAGSAFAQANTDTETANASARVVAAIALTKTADLNFGDVVASAAAGTVVMSPAGARSATLGATLGNANGAAAAAFGVTGVAAATYAISLPGAAISISDGGANTMSVGTFTGSKATGTLSGAGADNFTVGATLSVGANQVAGSYTGTFNVSVNYN
ncbi:MAG: DUF4402 domain-containing protein [Thermoanaerobaculia bacterium]|nr:DUF4402 domain-containing protein [Thermoanaerobaculia bacterium]